MLNQKSVNLSSLNERMASLNDSLEKLNASKKAGTADNVQHETSNDAESLKSKPLSSQVL